MAARSRVVLLNGIGSAGKSTIATALQTAAADVYLHVQMDAFLEMLPESMLDDPQGFVFERSPGDGPPEVSIASGPVAERAMRGMRRAVAAMADAGNDLVVDEVLGARELADYRALLARHELVVVAVTAPLAVLEERERLRGDRMVGLARWQFERVHVGIDYDLVLDTTALSPADCARMILAFVEGTAP